MSRKHIWYFLRDLDGHKIPDAKLKLYLAGTKNLATVYSMPVSGANDEIDQSTWTTDPSGFFEFFIGDFAEETNPEEAFEVSTELIADGDFELSGGDFPTSDWKYGPQEPDAPAEDDSFGAIGVEEYVHSGNVAISAYRGSVSGLTYWYQIVDSIPGAEMLFSFWSRGDETSSGRYSIYDMTNNADIIAPTNTGNSSSTYERVTAAFVVPAGCNFIMVRLWVPSVHGTAYYDTASLIQTIEEEGNIKVGYRADQLFDLKWVAPDTYSTPPSGVLTERSFFPLLFPVDETDPIDEAGNKLISNQQAYDFEAHIPLKVYSVGSGIQSGATDIFPETYQSVGYTFSGTYYQDNSIGVGMFPSPVDGNLRLYTTIPQGATILSAVITGVAQNAGLSRQLNSHFKIVESDDAPAITNYAQFTGTTWSATSVPFNLVNTYSANDVVTTPDISALLQLIVDRPGWAGGHIQLGWFNDVGTNNTGIYIWAVYDAVGHPTPFTGAPLKLTVTYEYGGSTSQQTYVHGVAPVDPTDPSDATFNKMVSDDLMRRLHRDLETLILCGGETITITSSGALVDQVSAISWSPSATGTYYADFPHALQRDKMYPIIQLYDMARREQIIPVQIMDINNQELRVWVADNSIDVVATIVGEVA